MTNIPDGYAQISMGPGIASSIEVRCLTCGLRVENAYATTHANSHLKPNPKVLRTLAAYIETAPTNYISPDRKSGWNKSVQQAIADALRGLADDTWTAP